MSDFLRDREIVNYELPVLAKPGAALDEALTKADTRWYALKRLASFNRLGLTAAGKKWNPLLHPRGPDGKFITKFGWVRMLVDGKWQRGYVKDIAGDGTITVEMQRSGLIKKLSHAEASKSLYALPKPKAHLDLPQLNTPHTNWSVTGPQGGSNPGKKFRLDVPLPTAGSFSPEAAAAVLPINGSSPKFNGPEIDKFTSIDGKVPKYGFIVQPDGAGYRIFAVTKSENGTPVIIDVATGEPGVVGDNLKIPPGPDTLMFELEDDGIDGHELINASVEARVAALKAMMPSSPGVGDEVYVKKQKSITHARNEVLANKLYELAGVPVPEVHLGDDPNFTGSKILAGDEILPLSAAFSEPELMSEIRENLVVDAWLANWDTVGLAYDNIVLVDGVPTRIDAGGSLLYRAQGGPKGKYFGGKVSELDTLRDKGMNPQAAKVFGKTTDEELRAGAARVAAIHPDTIRAYVEQAGLDDSLANTLIARRADLIERLLDGEDPHTPKPLNVPAPLEWFDTEKLLEMADTLMANDMFEGSTVQAELKSRGVDEKLKAIEAEADDLKSKGVDPKFKTVVPTNPDDVDSIAVVTDTSSGSDWLWDPKGKVWYRATYTAKISEAEDAVRTLVSPLIGDGSGPGKAVPMSIDDLFDGSSAELKSNAEGKWIWLGGHMWEVEGPGPLKSDKKFGKHPTVRLRNIGSGETIDLPKAAFYEADETFKTDTNYSWKTPPSGVENLLTIGYLVDPGEQRQLVQDALEALHAAQLNDAIFNRRANSLTNIGDLINMMSPGNWDWNEHATSGQKVAVSADAFGIHWTAPPVQLDGLKVGYYGDQTLDTDELTIGHSTAISSAYAIPAKSVKSLPPGAIVVLSRQQDDPYYKEVFQVTPEGKFRMLHRRGYGAKHSMVNEPRVGNEYSYSELVHFDTSEAGVWRASPAAETLALAVTERERLLADAEAKLSEAIEAEMAKGDGKSQVLADNDALALLEDAPPPPSIALYADYVKTRDAASSYFGIEQEFNPAASPLKFVGVAKFGDLAEGMWFVARPSRREGEDRTGADPVKITKIMRTEDGSIKHVEIVDMNGEYRTLGVTTLRAMFDARDKEKLEDMKALRIAPPAVAATKPTLKKSGEVVVDGLVVGEWQQGYGSRIVTIHAPFSASGAKIQFESKPSEAKTLAGRMIIVPPEHVAAIEAKNAKTKKVAAEIKWKTGKLSDGSAVASGTQVRSVVSGQEGTLVGLVHPQRDDLVYVKFENDKLEVVDAVSLISISAPTPKGGDGKPSPKKATPKDAIPIATDLPPEVLEAMETTPKNFVMADGGAPLVGMKVEAGKGAKIVTGHVLLINKAGYMRVKDEDGNLHWRSIKVAKALESPSYGDVAPVAATQATTKPELPDISVSLPPSADSAVPQAPDAELAGVRFLQSKEQIEKHVETGGALTYDGFVPDVGLPVFDRQGNRLIIAAKINSSKDTVRVYDPADPLKLKTRKVTGLTVDLASYAGDHGAISNVELVFNGHTKSLPMGIPPGSSIYQASDVTIGQARASAHIIIVTPDGSVYKSSLMQEWSTTGASPTWHYHYKYDSKEFFAGTHSGGKITKLGVYDGTDDPTGTTVVFQPGKNTYKESFEAVTAILPAGEASGTTDFFEVIAQKKAEEAPKVLGPGGEAVTPEWLSGDLPEGAFGEPPGTPPRNPEKVNPVPLVTGAKADLKKKPPVKSSRVHSVHSAAQAVIDAKDSTEPNSGIRYAMMDEDYIEDTLVRFQVVKDADGVEYVELRMRLQEERAEEVADQLLTSNDVEYGGWTQSNTVNPTDLVDGDYIQVYKSSVTGGLKPVEEPTGANARVTGPAEYIGKSEASGFDVYRVPVVLTTGEKITVDMEMRNSASVGLLTWDPDMAIDKGGKGTNFTVSKGAVEAGWEARGTGGVSTPYTKSSDVGTHVTETGVAKLVDSQEKHPSSGGYSSGTIGTSGGAVLYRTMPDGTVIRFNAVPSTSSGGTTQGSARRSEVARDVRVRVPITATDIDAAMSSALEAVGVPVEKQVPPSEEALIKFSVNKINNHFNPTFKHREKIDLNDTSAGSQEIAAVLAQASSVLKLSTADALTLDDIELNVSSDGRVTPMLSKRAAQAVTKRQGNVYYKHSIGYGNDAEIITSIFGSPASTGLMSTDERWSFGVTTTGQSSSTDMRNGAGDRVYITGVGSTSIAGKVILSAVAVNRTLDGYVNQGDGWGKRSAKNDFVTRGSAYEYMVKRRFDVEQIAYVIVDSSERSKILAELKKRGVTEIGGRAIESIIVTERPKVDAGFQDIGVDVFETGATLGGLAGASAGGAVGGPA